MIIDFKEVSPAGLESSPVASALAGLRANEARYFSTHYQTALETFPAGSEPGRSVLAFVNEVVESERDLTFAAKPLEVALLRVQDHKADRIDDYCWAFVFYEDGLEVNVMYALNNPKKRAVGFKLSEGMGVPPELVAAGFKFARQRSKLAGEIRGSFFVIKGEHEFQG